MRTFRSIVVFTGLHVQMSSAQYSLVTTGAGRRSSSTDEDSYRSPFSPFGQAAFVWSERALPLAYILKDNALPIVVKVRFMPLTFLSTSVT